MAVVADRVIVELEAKLDQYNARITAADQKFGTAMNSIQKNAGRAEAFVRRSVAGMSAALGSVGLVALGAQAVETALRFQRFEKGLEVATGSAAAAGDEIKFLRDLSDQLGVRFITLAENFTGVAAAARGTTLEGQRARDVFESVTKAIIATGGSAEQVDGALLAVEQIISKGNVSAEELRGQLGERLPGAFQIAARAMGVTTAELDKMLQKGEVVSTDFLPKFAAQLGKELPSNLQTADAAFQRFQTALDDIAASTADGFMKELGDATDDLTQTLKDMQASGALEAIGSFLGEVIRLGSGAIGVIGDLALAWKKFRLEVGVRQQQGIENGFLTSASDKEEARKNRTRLEAELVRMSGGAAPSFAQGSLDSIDKVIKAQGSARSSSAAASGSGGGKAKPKSKISEDAFTREEASLNDAILRLKADEASTAEERAAFELDRIEKARAAANLEYQTDERLKPAWKQKLVALNDQLAAMDKAKVAYEREAEIADRAYELETTGNRYEQDLLQSQLEIADTRRQQLAIDRRILLLRQSQERADLERLRDSKNPNMVARKIEQDKGLAGLARLDQRQQNERATLERRYESPLARYRRNLDETNTSDRVEELVVQELDYVRDGISDAISKRLGIKDPFLAGLLDMFIEQQIMKPLANALAGASGGSGGGLLGSIISIGSSLSRSSGGGSTGTGVGFASGGSGTIGGRGGTDTNVLSLNGQPFANVSRGETLSVGSKALKGRSGGDTFINAPQFNLAGAVVTRELYADMERISNQSATRAGAASYAQSQQSAPGTISKYTQLKG